MSKEKKIIEYQKNKRTFSFTNKNLELFDIVSKNMLSEKNLTKLVNYLVHLGLSVIVDEFKKAKTPDQKDKIMTDLTKEVKKYANTEEKFR